jgi:hypothetical protein
MDRGDDAERPPTTRIGPAAGAASRGLSMVVVLVALALVVAVLKPWDWIAAPPVGPGREGAAIAGVLPATSPTVVPTPASPDWTGAGPQVACLSGTSWLAVVDQVNGPVTSRSWTRLDLVPATGPLDPAIARTHVYAESVPRIGFCAPGSANAAGAAGASAQFRVRAWRLTSVEALADGSATDSIASRRADEIVPPVVSGGTIAEGGSLFGPPEELAVGGGEGQAPDREDAWAVGGAAPGSAGGAAPGSARWRAYGGGPVQASWPPSIYVFRVDALGSGPAGSGVAWFAIELRGPWAGPAESPTP